MPKLPSASLIQEASALIEARTGLSCAAQLRVNLEAILAELGGNDGVAFVQNLRAAPDSSATWQRLMQALVIGETYFFRNRAHFQLLSDVILPDISPRRRGLNFWSAGCASGEETYSIGMTLYEHLPDYASRKIHLIGTDINNYAVIAARNAVYRSWAFRQTDSAFRARYFDAVEGGYHVKSFIQSMATFRQANLLAGAPLPQLDVIFCCNVLLYFEDAAVARAENLLFEALAPGGWLILGQAEAVRSQRERWTTHIFPGAIAYQKPLSAHNSTIWQIAPPARNGSAEKTVQPKTPAPIPQSYPDAVTCFRAEQYAEAERILLSVLAQQPGHAAAHVLSACIFANRGAMTRAQHYLDKALKLDSLQADAHYLKGVLYLETGSDSSAMEALRAAIYCRRGHPLAAMILGTLYLRKHETSRARRTWDEALEMLDGAPPDAPVCDLSDMTAESIVSFLSSQLESL
jgi:chemotaxis protein methyltransferase CheR